MNNLFRTAVAAAVLSMVAPALAAQDTATANDPTGTGSEKAAAAQPAKAHKKASRHPTAAQPKTPSSQSSEGSSGAADAAKGASK